MGFYVMVRLYDSIRIWLLAILSWCSFAESIFAYFSNGKSTTTGGFLSHGRSPQQNHDCFNPKSWSSMTWMIPGTPMTLETSIQVRM